MNGVGDALLLAAAGVLAGLVGTAGGITSLISYPALLAAGLPALAANVANIVAAVACWPGAALASRPELAGQGPWLRRWVPVAALGGAAGSALLMSTPPGVFARVVPFLVAAGSLALLAQPRLAALRGHRDGGVLLPAALVALSVYNGYFGAGSGVMILALLLITAEPRLPTANALKNMLLGAGVLVSAAAFAVFTPVAWTAVVPLSVGLFAGSTLGPLVTRRVPARVLRPLVALVGLVLAVVLWIQPHG
ncbi:sulfite exporter TauE/SafE family protein [Nonomuraea roseoviolacea subsp. roseoviolacea]|uniref:Probable membrane transporter protein n=1 Tax=Nonomuraea roseoviolacea subsp. carminata TaxID=160689 RepID=A0ABT1KDC3_9ACTN|nr:sulfite exporter TauE/SafE family protein [Nonomuraea roseoviolacea]MCP2352023.1 putative membrane protein YfcA [Nonomuraea roseoviolacea subsp. carminata]